ncbi:hypothetical protein ACOSQ4_015552 [Xanthoceras sorbifolium]
MSLLKQWILISLFSNLNVLSDRKRVLEGGPWAFDKHILVLKEVSSLGKLAEEAFYWVPFWIQLYNLPLACMCKEVGVALGVIIGRVKEVELGANGRCLRMWM